MHTPGSKILFAGTIFSSSFLLFLVQPLIAKQILPWFGGSAAVWSVCMVFFQVTLLAGYAYADWLSRRLPPRRQVQVHVALLAASLAMLPILAGPQWKPTGEADPTLWILGLLIATIGLPYFMLSTTGPLLQSWVARSVIGIHVYRYFSLSNLASLLALMSYPFLIEPHARLVTQAYVWSGVFVLFALSCAGSAWYFLQHTHRLPPAAHAVSHEPEGDWDPQTRDYLLWLGLSAMGSWLLVAITNHITQNVAAIPFLWLLPLSIYLLTFVLCFESDRWYRRAAFLPVTAVLLLVCAYGLQDSAIGVNIKVAIPLYAVGLFFFCMFLHGELARRRPGPRYLTRFYLMLSLGGALGGITVGLIAPRILPAYYELGIGLIITALLAMAVLRPSPNARRPVGALGSATAAVLAVLCGYFLYVQVADDLADTRRLTRNFYGNLQSVDVHRKDARDDVRQLYHGSIKHGEQFLAPDRHLLPTTYYGPTSGIGRAIAGTAGKRVGLIGLGAGTLAVYGRPGDVYRFYEINPQVLELARSEFSFMNESKAQIETALGDARLTLEREAPQGFDVLAVDAFSGDSVPVHLITAQAMDLYLRHLNADGIIAFHVTNRFLWLPPVVQEIARTKGLSTALIRDDPDGPGLRRTDWILVARNPQVLERTGIRAAATPVAPIPGLTAWTDDFNNLFQILK
ncbi:fused MFS/spermidine synthase [uncultured Thiodictyon sp.]|uniref:fused MFS/spermidine synthase n=1 Tax=uncultured Thiodictyon sp. TaxID=1846217 RepID=UPI0025FA8384|nr:fused MFS/spermidine synthase [uncultured Thiodictyon sp.]